MEPDIDVIAPAPAAKSQKRLIIILVTVIVCLLLFIIAGLAILLIRNNNATSTTASDTPVPTPVAPMTNPPPAEVVATPPATGPDLTQLPLGDQRYTSAPKVGYIYLCNTTLNGGGAFQAGPWINQTAGTWNLTTKVHVDGQVDWANANVSFTLNGSTRQVSGNGLPGHTTGNYPISSSDDAYTYDRNPNSIQTQTVLLNLPASPQIAATPSCMGGEVGIMLSGIPLFNGFDAGGRDAAAWEVQDACAGHPQASGQYHYHSDSECLTDDTDINEHSQLQGYALDGFGIFDQKGENGNVLSTQDLDECHGHTHEIMWDGQLQNMYHYHLTADFPYSVSCFKGNPVSRQIISGGNQGMTMPQIPPQMPPMPKPPMPPLPQ